jgi:hypothetical protein
VHFEAFAHAVCHTLALFGRDYRRSKVAEAGLDAFSH